MSIAGQAERPLDVREFASDDAAPRNARRFVTAVLTQRRADERVVADLTLVASELVSNAVEHVGDGAITVSVGSHDGVEWLLDVQCRVPPTGEYPPVADWIVARPDHPSGRGLGIVRGLTDTVAVEASGGLLVVRCRRRAGV